MDGGAGGDGRIRIEYCGSAVGSTIPAASTQKLTCYVAEQTESAPYTAGRLNLPENVNISKTYQAQYGRRLNFSAAASQATTVTVPAAMASTVTIQSLISQLPTNATFTLDIGADGSNEWTSAVANASTNPSPNLAAAFNAYWIAQGAPVTGTLDVPVKVTLSQSGQVLLTNLQVTTAGSKQRIVRLPSGSYSSFTLDFTLGGTGSGARTVALDVGADGSIDWSYAGSPTLPFTQQTGNLAAAVNAYLAGKSGDVDVPLRFFVAPDAPVTLVDYAATPIRSADPAASSLSLGNVERVANSLYIAGAIVPVAASLRNNGSQATGPVTAAFFAHAAGWGDWYIGSTYFGDIAPGAAVHGDVQWDTTGFSGTVPVKVVINPYGRVVESNPLNNTAIATATVIGAAGAVLAIAPPTVTAGQGQQVSVDLVVRTDRPVDGAAAYLDFDRTKLQVASITPGTALATPIQNTYSNTLGTLAFVAGTLDVPPASDFVLATVTFTATALTPGTPLTFAALAPRRSDVTYGGASSLDHTEGGTLIVENVTATLTGHVTPPGRPAAPHARWQVPLVVTLSQGGAPLATFTPTTDQSGYFTVTGIAPGSYQVGVKQANTLRNRLSATLAVGANTLECGALRPGDGNGDNCVALVDFSILRTTFGKCQGDAGYDPRADYNGDGCVTLVDFSLLRSSFGVCGDATAQRTPPILPATPTAKMGALLDTAVVTAGMTVTLTIQVDPAGSPVDGAAAYLTFDPALLQVVTTTAGRALPTVIQDEFDNAAGQLAFAAGSFEQLPAVPFTLATVELRAITAGAATLAFATTPPRQTDVTAAGVSVLAEFEDGQLTITPSANGAQRNQTYLPLVGD